MYVAGQVLKKLLQTFPDKVDGQQALAAKKADLIYGALDAYPEVYRVVPDKSVRSRMNICFRVTKVSTQRAITTHTGVALIFLGRTDPSTRPKRRSSRSRLPSG